MQIIIAHDSTHFEIAHQLFREYADSLGIGLDYQGFEQELSSLHLQYAAPEGAIFEKKLD